jgi:hypothetical protein
MKKLLIPVLAAATIISAASCSKSSSGPSTPQAQVLYFNAWLAGLQLNITANTTAVPNGTNLGFLKNTGYQNITAGVAEDIAFIYASTTTKLIDTTVTFTASTHYSAFVTGVSPLAQIVTSDDLTAPAAGMAKVRFVNLSPDTVGYNLYVGANSVTATSVKYRGVSAYASVPATSSATVLASDPYSPPIQTTLSSQSFGAGKIYTIVLTGQTTGTGSAVNTLTIINNN